MFEDLRNKESEKPTTTAEKILDPINYSRALEIVQAHMPDLENQFCMAYYYVGRNKRFDMESLKDAFQADKTEHRLAFCEYGRNCLTKHFMFSHYDIAVRNPKSIVGNLLVDRKSFPLLSLQAFNLGNIQYAGILFDSMQAVVKPEYFPELEKQGFNCWVAKAPGESIEHGPFKNVFTLDEAFGPGAAEWAKAMEDGSAPESCLIINH